MFGSPNSAETSYSSYVTNQQEILTKAYKKSLRKHQTKTAQTKKVYNHRVHGKPYKGNLVWLFNPAVEGIYQEFNKPWSGPYRICDKLSDVNYQTHSKQQNQSSSFSQTETLPKWYSVYSQKT